MPGTVDRRGLRPPQSRLESPRRPAAMTLVALCLVTGCSAPGDRLLDEGGFTRAFVAALAEEDGDLATEIQAPLRVGVGGGEELRQVVFLGNAFREYLVAPEDLAALLEAHVQSTLETHAFDIDGAIDISRVMPVIKDAAYPAEVAGNSGGIGRSGGPEMFHEPLNGELVVMYAVDAEYSIRYLDAEGVASLGLEPAALRRRAVENLLALLPEVRIKGLAGTFEVQADGYYETSLLLADAVWTKENFPVQGEIVVGIPSRGVLVVTGSEAPANLALLRQMAQELAASETYAITADLFVRRNEAWERFTEDR